MLSCLLYNAAATAAAVAKRRWTPRWLPGRTLLALALLVKPEQKQQQLVLLLLLRMRSSPLDPALVVAVTTRTTAAAACIFPQQWPRMV